MLVFVYERTALVLVLVCEYAVYNFPRCCVVHKPVNSAVDRPKSLFLGYPHQNNVLHARTDRRY